MPKYQARLYFSNGDTLDDDYTYDTEAEAEESALNMISDYHTGIENLHNSNPGDNLLDDDEIDYEIFEIDD